MTRIQRGVMPSLIPLTLSVLLDRIGEVRQVIVLEVDNSATSIGPLYAAIEVSCCRMRAFKKLPLPVVHTYF